MNFINPKTDFAFKKIFGSPESKGILISFLNALIYQGESIIEDLEIIDPYLAPQITGLKDTYLDVKAKLNDGSLVIIEMQVLNVESFAKRILYNAAKAYSLQLNAGEGYRFLKPVIALTITDFIMFEESNSLISHFIFKEKDNNFTLPEGELSLVFVELPRFAKDSNHLDSLTDKWIYFLKSSNTLESVPTTMVDVPEIQQAFRKADRANLSPQELEDLEKREIFIQDQKGIIVQAKKEAKKEGLIEGKMEGKMEKAIEIARKLLDVLDDETISQTTGLSLEEVRTLR
ncbi:Rpn family recombination-promoting nuclease/putative transposase [Lusitaniella coriacea LEGE 07157]|uniref:Rpn family recombination-promoting nuclease/putative transposase n=1 Tax=Lusitaniella coriacea LEGE 07157 TaxID=945747 RepID=A0A8J7IVT1_9CYAN|nr:Rpn family recombination-promoting nuclease/putative transposase [Lusitaniella coriacea]MBE9117508.1 Rpn family recombination-promoting nuclease/putative transposase [Lusitaniella coriacea LEGE 07157]